jgi:hypothetical protein
MVTNVTKDAWRDVYNLLLQIYRYILSRIITDNKLITRYLYDLFKFYFS